MLLIISSISHDEETQHGKTYDTIMKFVRHYDHRNCTLFMNNFFTSPQLMKDLALKVIAVCGSVQLNRRGMPPKSQLNDRLLKSLHRGQSLHFQKDNMCLAIWKDASVMKVLSNHIQPTAAASSLKRWGVNGERIEVLCPQAIKDYFYHARSVDVVGQLRYSYPTGRKAKNQTSRLVWSLIDICIVNAFTLYTIGREEKTHLQFRIELMHELVQSFREMIEATQESSVGHSNIPLAKDHYPVKAATQRDCKQCSERPHTRKLSHYVCHACNVHRPLLWCIPQPSLDLNITHIKLYFPTSSTACIPQLQSLGLL
jgi:hypothetical protein